MDLILLSLSIKIFEFEFESVTPHLNIPGSFTKFFLVSKLLHICTFLPGDVTWAVSRTQMVDT